jgi:tetratricopeptide (TPR) repeat protein
MYSLGLVLQELFTGNPAMDPGLSADEVLARSQQGLSDPVRGLDGDLTELLEQLKALSPSVRPTAVETLRRLKWIQRKPQRRMRRALLAALLLAAAAGTAKYTLDLRAARGRAQARIEAALGMMETVLEKQIPVLEQVGRLEVFDAVADGVQAYLDGIAREERTDPERLKLARLLMSVGNVREKQGRPEEALEIFQEALALTEDLAKRSPRDSETLLALGAAHFYIGQHELQFTKPANATAALERFRAYLEQAQRNAEFDVDRARALRELSYARSAIAGALLAQGKPKEALDEQVEVVEVARELRAEQPDDQQVRLDLADSLSWLASAQSEAGRPEEALASLEEELDLRRDMLAMDKRNAEARTRLAYCLTFLGQLHLEQKRFGPAVETAGEASDLLVSLCKEDPVNADLGERLKVAKDVFERAQSSQ